MSSPVNLSKILRARFETEENKFQIFKICGTVETKMEENRRQLVKSLLKDVFVHSHDKIVKSNKYAPNTQLYFFFHTERKIIETIEMCINEKYKT